MLRKGLPFKKKGSSVEHTFLDFGLKFLALKSNTYKCSLLFMNVIFTYNEQHLPMGLLDDISIVDSWDQLKGLAFIACKFEIIPFFNKQDLPHTGKADL